MDGEGVCEGSVCCAVGVGGGGDGSIKGLRGLEKVESKHGNVGCLAGPCRDDLSLD